MLAKKTAKNQLTLPKEIADRFPGTEYFDVRVEGNTITLRPVRILLDDEEGEIGDIRAKVKRLGVTEADVAAAVQWARKRG